MSKPEFPELDRIYERFAFSPHMYEQAYSPHKIYNPLYKQYTSYFAPQSPLMKASTFYPVQTPYDTLLYDDKMQKLNQSINFYNLMDVIDNASKRLFYEQSLDYSDPDALILSRKYKKQSPAGVFEYPLIFDRKKMEDENYSAIVGTPSSIPAHYNKDVIVVSDPCFSPNLKHNVSKYYYKKIINKWLKEDTEYNKLLNYLTIKNGKVEIKEDGVTSKDPEIINKKIDYIKTYLLDKADIQDMLSKLINKRGYDWCLLYKNKRASKSIVKKYLLKKLNKYFKEQIH